MVPIVNALIIYATLSGNTEEVAKLIGDALPEVSVDYFDINGLAKLPDFSEYDVIFIGTYTWDYGYAPIEATEFVWDFFDELKRSYVFGTGDTQFGGDDLFCKAADTLAEMFQPSMPPLKVEQSPRGSQETKVTEWAKGVLNDASKRIINEGTRTKSEKSE